MGRIEKWLCVNCKFILGFVEDKLIIRIKRKDLYVEISECGKVAVNCCRCGTRNELNDDRSKTREGGTQDGLQRSQL